MLQVASYALDGVFGTQDEAVPGREFGGAWICALPLELAASRAMLDEEYPLPANQSGDDNNYMLGRND